MRGVERILGTRQASRIVAAVVAGIVGLAVGDAAAQADPPSEGDVEAAAEGDVEAAAKGDAEATPEEEIVDTDPHTMILAGVGLLALPFAEVCPSTGVACEPGETSLGLSVFTLGRFGNWGFGASITYAFGLRSTQAVGSEVPGLERRHERRYFLVEGHFRRYLPPLGAWNWWVGPTLGAVIINDSWSTLADREPYSDTAFVGPRAVSLATEGLAFGAAIGGHIRFLDYWIFGTQFRYANWLLPGERDQTPVGDLASLAGRLDIFDVGVITGFHLPI
jgi:hypothetical protein